MELTRVDTQKAYELIKDRIITLALVPGKPIHEQKLAEELGMALTPVQEALTLLVHDNLVAIKPRHGFYVTGVDLADLQQLSELRLPLEAMAARLAALRANPDDLAVLDAIRQEQLVTDPGAPMRFFEIDHKFHRAIAEAAHNKYLAQTLSQLFGLSLRLWYVLLPHLSLMPAMVNMHLDLVNAIRRGDEVAAGEIMHAHVAEFYAQVRDVLAKQEGTGG